MSGNLRAENELMFDWIDPRTLDSLGKLLLATFCGGLVGLERTYRGKPAGVRTNILICLGACLVMVVSERVSAEARLAGYLNADPARIAAQVVTGIGFLGAGTILSNRGIITGLTSAASIWVVAAIGLAVGADMGWLALFSAVLCVAVVELFGLVVRQIRVERFRYYRLEAIIAKEPVIHEMRKTLRRHKVLYSQESTEKVVGERHYRCELYAHTDQQVLETALTSVKGVKHLVLLRQHAE